jgi:hypothetical protein
MYPVEAGKVDRLLIEDRIEEAKAEADNQKFVDVLKAPSGDHFGLRNVKVQLY